MDFQRSNRFLISQRFTALVNRFDLSTAEGEPVGFAEQKRFNLREQVTVWKSEDKAEALFTIEAEKVFDVHGKYLVRDEAGEPVGYLRKQFLRSLIRSTWEAYDTQDTLLYEARERNVAIALTRRIGGLIPVIGDLLVQLPFGFDLRSEGRVIGYHRRKRGLRDRYEISLDEDFAATDKRLLLALGLLLDILQQR
jgi:hypothetical protein